MREGVYAMLGGPNYETVAELKMLRYNEDINNERKERVCLHYTLKYWDTTV